MASWSLLIGIDEAWLILAGLLVDVKLLVK